MILTVVGSGTLVPSARRATPSLTIETEDLQVTVDGGSGTLRRQAELGIDFRNTHTLFFTHVHPDHTLDLLHFLFASKYTPGFMRRDPVRIVGPRGFTSFVGHLRDGISSWTDGGEVGIEILELRDRETLTLGSLTVEAVELNHSVTNIGYRFGSSEGRTVAFTGDTAWCEGLIDLARGVDVLVTECSGDAAHAAPGHLTSPEIGRLAQKAQVKQVVLSHLYPLPSDAARLRETAESYDGPVVLAEDGMRFVV